MKNWKKNWWNPLWYLGAIADTVFYVITGILRFFGVDIPQPRPVHADIQPEDVDRAYNDASAAEEVADFAPEIDQRARGFLRYIESSPEDRRAFDLSVFDDRLQDFILDLTEDDIDELRRRGPVGQLQAALIGRIPTWSETKAAPDVRPEPSKAELVRARFLDRVRRRSEQGADSLRPVDYAPSPRG